MPCYNLLPVTESTLGPACAETSGIPGSLELLGGIEIYDTLLCPILTPLGKRFSRTLAVSVTFCFLSLCTHTISYTNNLLKAIVTQMFLAGHHSDNFFK